MPLNTNFSPSETINADELAARRGLVKFDLSTTLEQFLMVSGIITLVIGLMMLQIGTLGGRHSRPNPAVLPYLPIPVLASVMFFVARYFTDNYYLVDPQQHLVYYHFKFLWFRSVRLALRREDILAVTTRGRKCSSRSSSWWEYEVVLVGANGHLVPFSDSKREALDECNMQAERLARMLDCEAYSSPACCELDVEVIEGKVSVSFEPLRWGLTRRGWRWLAICAFIVVLCLAALWFVRL
jgi:hypothetical protein